MQDVEHAVGERDGSRQGGHAVGEVGTWAQLVEEVRHRGDIVA
jgi:hypothetical protein